jgi:predicted nuclease of restriction endonuclease-like (RecB) superfamily
MFNVKYRRCKNLFITKVDYTTSFEYDDESEKLNCPKDLNIEIGKKVKIINIKKEGMDPEDYYYLKKFENRTGTIAEQNKCKSGKYTYKIEFDKGGFGYFYHEDFILANED